MEGFEFNCQTYKQSDLVSLIVTVKDNRVCHEKSTIDNFCITISCILSTKRSQIVLAIDLSHLAAI